MKKKVLIIDDEHANRYLLENILDEYETISLENGQKLWDYLQDNHAVLILLDIMMPNEDGYQIAKKLSLDEILKDIPIIFLTAKDAAQDIKKGFESGGYDYITKPFDEMTLKIRIQSVIEKKNLELQLKKQAITDPLTNLYNRRYFFDRLDKQIEFIKRNKNDLSVAILDIDFFKKINDSYGHLAGDFILQELSGKLVKYIRPYDIAARYGGEEFVVIFIDCNKKKSKLIMQRIKDKIENNSYNYENFKMNFTFSCGIADINDFPDQKVITSKEFIKIADDRLLEAKRSGRNMIINML